MANTVCEKCVHYDVCLLHEDNFIDDVAKNGFCGKFKNKSTFIEVVRCKDCILHEAGCPLDTHPCMTVDDGYCYLAKRTPKERSESDG